MKNPIGLTAAMAWLRNFWECQQFHQLQAVVIWNKIRDVDVAHPAYVMSKPPPPRQFRRSVRFLGWGCLYLFGCPVAVGALPAVILILLAVNTLGGMQVAALIGVRLSRYRASGLADLIAILPDGGERAQWLIALGTVQPTPTYEQLTSWRRWVPRLTWWLPVVLGGTLIVMIVFTSVVGLLVRDSNNADELLRVAVYLPIVGSHRRRCGCPDALL